MSNTTRFTVEDLNCAREYVRQAEAQNVDNTRKREFAVARTQAALKCPESHARLLVEQAVADLHAPQNTAQDSPVPAGSAVVDPRLQQVRDLKGWPENSPAAVQAGAGEPSPEARQTGERQAVTDYENAHKMEQGTKEGASHPATGEPGRTAPRNPNPKRK